MTEYKNNLNQIDNLNIIKKNILREIIKTKNSFLSKKNKINKRVSIFDIININDNNSYSIKEPNFKENNENYENNDINYNALVRYSKSNPNNPKVNNISKDKKINYIKTKKDSYGKI